MGKKTTEDFIKKAVTIHGHKYCYDKSNYISSGVKVCIECPEHGEFWQTPENHTSKTKPAGCPKCGHVKTWEKRSSHLTTAHFIDRSHIIHDTKYDYSKSEYIKTSQKLCIICPKHGEFWQRPNDHLQGKGCPKCANNTLSNTQDFINKCISKHGVKYDYSGVDYKHAKMHVCIKCLVHGDFLQMPTNHLKLEGCPKCKNDFFTSQCEKDIVSHIKSAYDGTIETSNRNILKNKKELDIYLPELKIAFEFNGLYWHSEEFVPNNYHLAKTKECEEQGIQLIHIFEDEWNYKKEIVKSRILNIIGKTPNTIYARKCAIKEVPLKEANHFLEQNHIQGKCVSKYRYGLYHNNELVSLMTFGSLRKNMGGVAKEGEFELLRFCNKLNTTIVGGASKLFKHFIKNHNPLSIISYADKRWSQGKLYEKLGFEFSGESQPNYYYITNNNLLREYRFKYRKDVLVKQGFDPTLSEREIMLSRGIYRIYDCGCKRYKWG